MSKIRYRSWPLVLTGIVFPNQEGKVCLIWVDEDEEEQKSLFSKNRKVYLADEKFLNQLARGEAELRGTILLKEGELIIEDAESGETSVREVSGTTAGRQSEIFCNGGNEEGSSGQCDEEVPWLL